LEGDFTMSNELFDAIRVGDAARVSTLVAGQPALARERDQNGISAIMQARYQGHANVIEALRPVAGDLDIFEASALGDVSRLKELLSANPSLVRSYSADGFTPLHLASYFSQPEAAAELLRGGADCNAVATNGTKLAIINSAAASGNNEVVKLVLAAGANPNAQQQGGYTALHAAAMRKNLEMVRALLDAGADPAIATNDGKRAVDFGGEKVAALLPRPSASGRHT
jgi:ankyrin repeat protein